jgi:hypothetical protein
VRDYYERNRSVGWTGFRFRSAGVVLLVHALFHAHCRRFAQLWDRWAEVVKRGDGMTDLMGASKVRTNRSNSLGGAYGTEHRSSRMGASMGMGDGQSHSMGGGAFSPRSRSYSAPADNNDSPISSQGGGRFTASGLKLSDLTINTGDGAGGIEGGTTPTPRTTASTSDDFDFNFERRYSAHESPSDVLLAMSQQQRSRTQPYQRSKLGMPSAIGGGMGGHASPVSTTGSAELYAATADSAAAAGGMGTESVDRLDMDIGQFAVRDFVDILAIQRRHQLDRLDTSLARY